MKLDRSLSDTTLARSEDKCPGCGKMLSDWPEQGHLQAGVRYCCQGCAEGSGCTCAEQ